jgi:clan AA aspartic protease (TIGR02281 family)
LVTKAKDHFDLYDDERGISFFTVLFIVIIASAAVAGGLLYYNGFRPADLLSAGRADPIYERLGIEPLPVSVERSPTVARSLNVVRREPCDWQAIHSLSTVLGAQAHRRDGARVLLRYSETCRRSSTALYQAANILLELSDFDLALAVIDDLITTDGDRPDPNYLRGLILAAKGDHEDAISSLTTVVEVHPDLQRISSSVFYQMSKSYEALGDTCAAISPIQTWMSLSTENLNNRHAESLVRDLSRRGECSTYASGEARFPVAGSSVIMAEVTVNGIVGTFVVDTGATFVSVSDDFARRAKIHVTDQSVKLQTANGIVTAKRGTIEDVRVGGASASQVAAVISDGDVYEGFDGLLGRSFLARFDTTFGANEWHLSPL